MSTIRIVCISDTHCKHKALGQLPEGDVLIHAGDALSQGTGMEFWPFAVWMAAQRFAHKIYVPGNHDFFVQRNPDIAKNLLAEGGTTMLVDRAVRAVGLKFVGVPWVPNLKGWAYYGDHLALLHRFGRIPDNTQVLITHTPPTGIEDMTNYSHVGSSELSERLAHLKQLKLHVFGHIHEGYGVYGASDWTSVNAVICTREYKPTNKPIVIDLEV